MAADPLESSVVEVWANVEAAKNAVKQHNRVIFAVFMVNSKRVKDGKWKEFLRYWQELLFLPDWNAVQIERAGICHWRCLGKAGTFGCFAEHVRQIEILRLAYFQ